MWAYLHATIFMDETKYEKGRNIHSIFARALDYSKRL
jgi:hypothetical protein